MPAAKVVAALEALRSTEPRVREEALVAVCRVLARRGETDAAWRIAMILAARVKHRVARSLRFWRLDRPESVAQDVVDDVISNLYEAVFDDTNKSLFWEIRFWVAFDRRLLTAIRAKRMEIDRTMELAFAGDEAEDVEPGVAIVRECPEGRTQSLADPLTNVLVTEALAGMEENVRTAYILKYAADMPEDSRRPDELRTIAKVLGVSGRTVRNYLRRAEQEIEEWRAGGSAKGGADR